MKWSQDKSTHKVFTSFVCALMMWGGGLESVQIFILAERLKIVFFLALSSRESSLVQTLCEYCVQLDIIYPSVVSPGNIASGFRVKIEKEMLHVLYTLFYIC